MQRQEALPATLPEYTSLRDFGGCYLVHGRYLLHVRGAVLRGFGWALREGTIVENVCGPCWEYPLLVFERS